MAEVMVVVDLVVVMGEVAMEVMVAEAMGAMVAE